MASTISDSHVYFPLLILAVRLPFLHQGELRVRPVRRAGDHHRRVDLRRDPDGGRRLQRERPRDAVQLPQRPGRDHRGFTLVGLNCSRSRRVLLCVAVCSELMMHSTVLCLCVLLRAGSGFPTRSSGGTPFSAGRIASPCWLLLLHRSLRSDLCAIMLSSSPTRAFLLCNLYSVKAGKKATDNTK